MNILIINQPPFNRGDESAHKGLVRSLLRELPDAKIRVMSKYVLIDSIKQYAVKDERVEYIYEPIEYFQLNRFKQLGLKKKWHVLWAIHPLMLLYRRYYKWADLVMCAPGGICMGGFQDWDHLFLLYLAKYYKKPLAYYGRSFGPFPTETPNNRRFKELSIEIIKYFSFFSIRDYRSEKLAKELGAPYIQTVDSAFLDSPQTEIPYEISSVIADKQYMVFVPNYLLWHYAYKECASHEAILHFYMEIIDIIWRHNPEMNIVMLPQLFGRYDDYYLSDVSFFRDIATIKSDKRIIVTSDNYSSDIQQSIISQAKYVIGARYHSIVFAINQSVPCIALCYEHKMSGLLETLGRIDWIVDINNCFDSDNNKQIVLEKIDRIIPILSKEYELTVKAKQKAKDCMDCFVSKLKRNKI